jgi:hypothetical protein
MQQNSAPRELVTLLAAPVRDPKGQIVGILAASIPGSGLASLIGGTMLRDGGALVVFDSWATSSQVPVPALLSPSARFRELPVP